MKSSSASLSKLILLAFLSVSLMGMVPILIKLTSANEIVIGFTRLLIAGTGIFLLMVMNKSLAALKTLSWVDLKWLVLLGLIFSIHWYSYFYGIKTSTASLASIGVSTYGIQLLLLNWVFFNEKLSKLDSVAISIAFCGVVLASSNIFSQTEMLLGFMASIFSGSLYAFLAVINRKSSYLTTQQKALGQFGFGFICFSFFIPGANFALEVIDWEILLVLGIVCTLVAHTLWIKVSTELPGNLTAIIYYFYVPIAIVLSAIFFNDALTWQKVTGASLIIAANVMVLTLKKHKRSKLKHRPLGTNGN